MNRCTRFALTHKGHSGQQACLPFVLSISVVTLSVATLLLFPSVMRAADSEEFRGLWVVRHTLASPERVVEAIELAHHTNINALFVQVRGRGDAYYTSALVPPPPMSLVHYRSTP